MQRIWMKALIFVAVGAISALVTEDASAQGPIRRLFSRPFRRDNVVATTPTAMQSARTVTRVEAQPAQPGGQVAPAAGGQVAPAAATTDANANRDANVRPATAAAEVTTPAATPAATPQLTVQSTTSSPRGIPVLRRLRWRD
jgi:hypothetical protein